MKNNTKKLRILLLLDNAQRELQYLRLLKSVLSKKLRANVKIVGSVAELQRIYYELHHFQPHIVCVTQIIEKDMRDLAMYIKKSDALLCVIPSEVTVIPALSELLVNKKLPYDYLADRIFLPGKRMYELYKNTDIDKKKIKIVGTPKMATLINQPLNTFTSRQRFQTLFSIPNKPNIFIFTSFVPIAAESLNSDPAFGDHIKKFESNNLFLIKSKKKYLQAIAQLAQDFPNCNIILKPHPLEAATDYAHFKMPNFYLLPDVSFYTCLRSIDLCIHWSSTVATECWIKNITTLQYVPIQKKNAIAEFSGANPILKTYPELKSCVKKYLTKPLPLRYQREQKKFLHENYYLLDGKSSDRIATEIEKMLPNLIHTIYYAPAFSILIHFLRILERFCGVSLSRRFVSWFLPHFKWQYAVLNHVKE